MSTIKPLERIIITTKWSGIIQANLLFEMAAIAGMAKRLRAIAPTEAVVTFGLESSADVPIKAQMAAPSLSLRTHGPVYTGLANPVYPKMRLRTITRTG